MTIWGAFRGHQRLGLDIWTDPIGAGTTQTNVYVQVTLQVDDIWDFADNQVVVLSGSASGSWAFFNNMQPNQSRVFGPVTIANQGLSVGGGPTYNFHAELQGGYLNDNCFVDASYTLPARPIYPPSAPGAPTYSSIEGTRATVGWGLPADQGGQYPNYTWLQVGLSNFGNLVYDNQSPGWNGRSLSGLMPNTRYYARVAAHNDAGWGAWSGVSSFTTGPYLITGAPTLSGVEPNKLTTAWGGPNDPVGPARYQLQLATDSGFATVVHDSGQQNWATSRAITDLAQATWYYVRVRASAGNGWGSWSPTASVQTLAGVKVQVDGQWVDSIAYVRVDGAWVMANVHKRVDGAWVI